MPVKLPGVKDPECLGAAVLAGRGVGLYRSDGDIAAVTRGRTTARGITVCEPEAGRVNAYESTYDEFLSVSQRT
jgi:hypothetical protein